MPHELSTIKYFSGVPESQEPERKCSSQWTKGIWVTCIVCCVVGAYGIVHGGKLAYQVATGTTDKVSRRSSKSSDAFRFEKAINKFNIKHQPLMVGHRLFELIAGLSLLTGGALMMWRSPHARRVVFASCLLAMVFHLSSAMLSVYQFVSLKETFESVSSQALRRAGISGAHHKDIIQQGLGSMGFGHSLGVLFVLGLHSFLYGRIMYFIAQPHVREVFAEDPYPELREIEREAEAIDAIAYAESVRQQLAPTEEKPKKKVSATKFAKV